MATEDIQLLLNRFFDGITTEENEQALRNAYAQGNIPQGLSRDFELFMALQRTRENHTEPYSANFEQRISDNIDRYAKLDDNRTARRHSLRLTTLWFAGIAACFALLVSMGVISMPSNVSPLPVTQEELSALNTENYFAQTFEKLKTDIPDAIDNAVARYKQAAEEQQAEITPAHMQDNSNPVTVQPQEATLSTAASTTEQTVQPLNRQANPASEVSTSPVYQKQTDNSIKTEQRYTARKAVRKPAVLEPDSEDITLARADTYDSPEMASYEVQQALDRLATTLNKSVTKVRKEYREVGLKMKDINNSTTQTVI